MYQSWCLKGGKQITGVIQHSFEGAARDRAVKSRRVIPALAQASASSCQLPSARGPRKLTMVLMPVFASAAMRIGPGWLLATAHQQQDADYASKEGSHDPSKSSLASRHHRAVCWAERSIS